MEARSSLVLPAGPQMRLNRTGILTHLHTAILMHECACPQRHPTCSQVQLRATQAPGPHVWPDTPSWVLPLRPAHAGSLCHGPGLAQWETEAQTEEATGLRLTCLDPTPYLQPAPLRPLLCGLSLGPVGPHPARCLVPQAGGSVAPREWASLCRASGGSHLCGGPVPLAGRGRCIWEAKEAWRVAGAGGVLRPQQGLLPGGACICSPLHFPGVTQTGGALFLFVMVGANHTDGTPSCGSRRQCQHAPSYVIQEAHTCV